MIMAVVSVSFIEHKRVPLRLVSFAKKSDTVLSDVGPTSAKRFVQKHSDLSRNIIILLSNVWNSQQYNL